MPIPDDKVPARRALLRAHRRLSLDRLNGHRSVAAHVGIELAGQHHRHSSVVLTIVGHMQDIVLPAFLGLHQSSSAGADLLCTQAVIAVLFMRCSSVCMGTQKFTIFLRRTFACTLATRSIRVLRAVSPHGVHNHRELASDRHDCLPVATLGKLGSPALQRRFATVARQHGACRFVERAAHIRVTGFADAALDVDRRAGLPSFGCQAKIGANIT